MVSTRDSTSSRYGRHKVFRVNMRGPSQACGHTLKLVEGFVRPRRFLIRDVFHPSHQKFYALIGRRTDVNFKPASDRLKVTASLSAFQPKESNVTRAIDSLLAQIPLGTIPILCWKIVRYTSKRETFQSGNVHSGKTIPFPMQECPKSFLCVIFSYCLQNVFETSCEPGFEYTCRHKGRSHCIGIQLFIEGFNITSCEPGFEYTNPQHFASEEQNTVESCECECECAQSAGNAAVSSSMHCPNLDNSPPYAESNFELREPLLDNNVTSKGDTKSLESPKGTSEGHKPNWGSLPGEIQGCVLSNLKYEDLFQVKLVCKGIQEFIGSPAFLSSRGDDVRKEGLLTSLFLYVRNGVLQWSGYDLVLKKWRPLPTLRCLPSPNIDLFKDYLVSSGGGLLCANVSSSLHNEELVVCNPMTQTKRVLPPLNFPRNPVLMHMLVNPATKSYKVIVAGSAGMTDGLILSRKTEVFDSLTSQWEVTDDLPGSEFSLNEYQTGVCINGILYCIAFMEDGSGKGVLAYNVEEGKWLSNWKCPLPCPGNAGSFSIAQLVECDGEVYLFSEREASRTVEHGIDKLELASGGIWKNVVKETRTGGRGLLLYPEFACVRFGVGKLCVFNTIEHTGKVYDIRNDGLVEPLPSIVKSKGGEMFHSLNPLSFTFEPNFQATVDSKSVSPLPEQNHYFPKLVLTEMSNG